MNRYNLEAEINIEEIYDNLYRIMEHRIGRKTAEIKLKNLQEELETIYTEGYSELFENIITILEEFAYEN